MANEQYLEEFVSPAGFKQLEDLNKAIDNTNKSLQAGITVAAQYAAAIGGSRGLGEFNRNTQAAANALEDLRRRTALATAAEERLEAQRQRNSAQAEQRAAREAAANDRIAASQERANQRARESSREYQILNAEHQRLYKAAQDLGIALGVESQEFKDAAKAANLLETQLRTVDERLRNNRRNVGNYASGFNGLQNSINQITRELPAFTFSMQTGFLAISNNLPIFFDQIARTRQEIAALRAEGQKVPGLFKQLATSIFSVGTLLSVLITLTTVYGKEIGEFVTSIFKGTKALNEFAESQRELGEALKSTDFSNAIKNVAELGINIDLAKKGFLDKDKVLKQYNTTIGQTTGEVKTLEEAEKALQKNADAYIKMTLYKAAAQAALSDASKKAVEAEAARLKGERESANALDKGASAVQLSPLTIIDQVVRVATLGQAKLGELDKANETLIKTRGAKRRKNTIAEAEKDQDLYEKIAADFQKKAATIAKQMGFDFFGKDFETKDKKPKKTKDNTLQDVIESSKEIINNEQATYDERFGALESFLSASNQLYRKNDGERAKALVDYKSYEKKITDDANESQLKAITELRKLEVQELTASNNDAFEKLEQIREKDTADLEARYQKGLLDKDQYESELFNIESSYAKDRLAVQIETLSKIVDIQRSDLAIGIGTNEALKKSERELSALRIQLAQLQRKEVKQTSAERIAAAEKELSAIKQLTEKSLEFGKALIDGIYTRRLNALADESASLDKKKQRDIENVNDSVATEEEKADKIAIINARAEAQQSVLDEKIRQQKIKQAKADKAQAIAQIIIQTALAQIKVIGQAGVLGFVFSPLITALGALSLATALATPIPKFAKGTDNSPQGLAYVGEQGTEGRINPDGSFELTPDKTTLTYLEKGTKIIPHHQLVSMMAKPDKVNYTGASQVPWSELMDETRQNGKRIEKAIKSQTVNSAVMSNGEMLKQKVKQASLSKHIGRNLGRN